MVEKSIKFTDDLTWDERMILWHWNVIFEVVQYRGLICQHHNLFFIIHTKEKGHNLPHVHVQYQQKEVVIEITTGRILGGNIPSKKGREASDWILKNQDFFRKHWNKLVAEGIQCPI